jgi:hypothetical protein
VDGGRWNEFLPLEFAHFAGSVVLSLGNVKALSAPDFSDFHGVEGESTGFV